MQSIERIRVGVQKAALLYPVKRVELFGSYADGTADENSDIDFLVEFSEKPISLLKICGFQQTLIEALQKDVDIVELPLREGSMLRINKTVRVYEN